MASVCHGMVTLHLTHICCQNNQSKSTCQSPSGASQCQAKLVKCSKIQGATCSFCCNHAIKCFAGAFNHHSMPVLESWLTNFVAGKLGPISLTLFSSALLSGSVRRSSASPSIAAATPPLVGANTVSLASKGRQKTGEQGVTAAQVFMRMELQLLYRTVPQATCS